MVCIAVIIRHVVRGGKSARTHRQAIETYAQTIHTTHIHTYIEKKSRRRERREKTQDYSRTSDDRHECYVQRLVDPATGDYDDLEGQ